MIKAELLDSNVRDRQRRAGQVVWLSHFLVGNGVSTVESTVPNGATEEVYLAGGLLSGANYERFVSRAAGRGFIVRTLRHGNNSIKGAIEADANELAAAIELHAEDRETHIAAHSKGGIVALKAAARLDPSIRLKSVKLINPAIKRSRLPKTAGEIIGAGVEQVACFGKLGNSARGVWHEITHRGLGVIGEIKDLFFGNDDVSAEVDALTERGVYTECVGGTFDHIVPRSSTDLALKHFHFDKTRMVDGFITGSHFGILASNSFVDSILPEQK